MTFFSDIANLQSHSFRRNNLSIFDELLNDIFNKNTKELVNLVLNLSDDDMDKLKQLVKTLHHMSYVGPIKPFLIDKKSEKTMYDSLAKLYQPHLTTADGNCVWNMVSISLCGNEELQLLLRKLTVLFLLLLKSSFLDIFTKEQTNLNSECAEKQIKKKVQVLFEKSITIAKTNKKWGNIYHLLALSTILNKPICIFNGFFTRQKGFKISKDSQLDVLKKDFANLGHCYIFKPLQNDVFLVNQEESYIYGFYRNNNHYVSLIPINNETILEFIPKND